MKSSLTILFLSTLLIPTTTASCAHNTFLHKRKLTYKRAESTNETLKTVEVGKFGYIGAVGPTNWTALSPDNIACSTSTQQSPIDITNTSTTLVNAGEVKLSIPAVEEAEFENIGTTVEVVMEGLGGTMIIPGGKEFELKQFHFHSPSEHTINGEYFPLEMHMVHQSAEDSTLTVLSALFTLSPLPLSPSTPLLLSLLPSLSSISVPGTITTTPPLNFTSLIAAVSAQPLHYYNGSLTTPPCREGLEFFVTSQPLEMDVLSFNSFKGVVGFNSRFTQGVVGEKNVLSAAGVAVTESKAVCGSETVVTGNKTAKVVTVDGSEGKEKVHEKVKEITGVDLSALGH